MNSSKNNCNEYALWAPSIGINTVSTPDANLDGRGAVSVFTSIDGSNIRSVTIKAIQSSIQGMIRLFIANADSSVVSLYREIIIPASPVAATTPVPAPQYIMFETILVGDLQLESGYSILASTQSAGAFNIFVEALNRPYPATLPAACCNFMQVTAETGIGTVSVANPNLDGSGAIVKVFQHTTFGSPGFYLKSITIKALQNTHEGAVRLFISPNNDFSWLLFRELWIPQTIQSAYQPSFSMVVDIGMYMPSICHIAAATQNAESFAITVEAEAISYPIS